MIYVSLFDGFYNKTPCRGTGPRATVMGATQTKEDEAPTSPKSPRVRPVDASLTGDETPVPALLDKEPSRGEMKSEMMALLLRVVEKVDA